ncbi:MAG: PEP-CTERM sorting domain-containing protein [Thermodesulfobacteriota bacterium]
MKKYLVLLICITCLCLGNPAYAGLFDFDSLPAWSDSTAIESYMEGIYGSDIEVVGAVVPPLVLPGPIFPRGDLGPDPCITNARDFGFMDISIKFVDIPISSMQFDWEVYEDSGPADFTWSAWDAADSFVAGYGYNTGVNWGTSPVISFSQPVYRIAFSNDGVHDIGIDNLNVTPVPEPASILLLSSGLLGLTGLRKRLFTKK